MAVVDQFLELWNRGEVDALRPLLADGFTYGEPRYPGPYDADGYVKVMNDVLGRIPDRRIEIAGRVPGAGSVAVTADWVGTMPDGSELRLAGIFVFDLTNDGDHITRMRGFYNDPG